jgi:hypothetical protein
VLGEEPRSPGETPASDEEPLESAEEPPASDWQPVRRVAPRVHSGELMSALSALLLIPIMFIFAWYGKVGVPQVRRSGMIGTEDAWYGLTLLRWLLLATIVVSLGSVVLHARQRGHGTRTATGAPVALLGTLAALWLGYRVLLDLPSTGTVVDVKLGAFLGLLATIGVALGGFESVREERARRDEVVQRSRKARSVVSGLPGR